MTVQKYGKYWAVYDSHGALVVVAVYKRGAQEVVKRLQAQDGDGAEARRSILKEMAYDDA